MLWHYWLESDCIVWTGGAVTTASFISVPSESPHLSRISRYSWQIAHRWQQKWVTKSPHGASYIRQENTVTQCIIQTCFIIVIIIYYKRHPLLSIWQFILSTKISLLQAILLLKKIRIDNHDTRNKYATREILRQMTVQCLEVFHRTRSIFKKNMQFLKV